MPFYDYFCEANNNTVEVKHEIGVHIDTWGELCRIADIDPGDTPTQSPVMRLISAPQVVKTVGDSRLKELGFTKLVKRDKGVYENVTATGKEKRFVKSDDPTSMPHLHKKIED